MSEKCEMLNGLECQSDKIATRKPRGVCKASVPSEAVGWGRLVGWLVVGGFKGAASQAALGLTPLQLSREQLGGKEIKFAWKSKCFWAWLSASWPSRPGLPSAAMVRSRNGCLIIKGEFLDMQVSVSPPSIRPWYFRISILSASLRPLKKRRDNIAVADMMADMTADMEVHIVADMVADVYSAQKGYPIVQAALVLEVPQRM